MALPPLASLEELEARLGLELTDEHDNPREPDGLRALAALEDASALIRSEAGISWVDEHDEILLSMPDVIRTICLAVAIRTFSNPQGATQATVGDVSVSFSRAGDTTASVFLTKAELRAIRRAGGRSSAGSIPLETGFVPGGREGRDLLWAPTEGGLGDPLPLGPTPWEV